MNMSVFRRSEKVSELTPGNPTPELGDVRRRSAFKAVAISLSLAVALPAIARDNGQYANSPLKGWFDSLSSKNGLCCSVAESSILKETDYEIRGNHYWARVDGKMVEVPDAAVIHQPNLFGRPMIWVIKAENGTDIIRCFMPGTES